MHQGNPKPVVLSRTSSFLSLRNSGWLLCLRLPLLLCFAISMAVLNSMARLPADGESVQSRSSGSIHIKPSVPTALAVEKAASAPILGEDVHGHEAAQQLEGCVLASKIHDAPAVGDRATVANVDARGREEECIANGEDQKIGENTMLPVPGCSAHTNTRSCVNQAMIAAAASAASQSIEVARECPQEVLSAASLKLENGGTAPNEGMTEAKENKIDETPAHVGENVPPETQGEPVPPETFAVIDEPLKACKPSDGLGDDEVESCTAAETRGIGIVPQPSVKVEANSEFVGAKSELSRRQMKPETVVDVKVLKNSGGVSTLTGREEQKQDALIVKSCQPNQGKFSIPQINGKEDSHLANPKREDVFFSSERFTGARDGYVFKTGDKGLGFYVEGYVDEQARSKPSLSHRPWNAGPGEEAAKRGPLGPVPKPCKKIVPFFTHEEKKAAEESDTRLFMARMVAQRNSRGFQSNLLEREGVLDNHILHLLEKFSDPSFFKKKHGYNVHGQMLGKDGKMIVKVTPEKTEEEKAKLSWYRKVYEDRLGKHLPSKRLGDSIEARREAYAYSRHFTAELNGREDELNKALIKALQGQTKLEFITEDYHYPGAYNTDGKVILEKGAPIENDLHRTDAQIERACTYRFKAIQRYRAAHGDIVGAISKKDKALQKVLKKTDPAILLEISEEAVTSTGVGIYRQTRRAGGGGSGGAPGDTSTVIQPVERPGQLRQKFSHSLKAEIKGKDKALLKEIACLEEDEAEQMLGEFGKGAEVLPNSWRQDPESLKRMQRRRKQLLAENAAAADRRKVVCPWRPGGKHIAKEPWQPLIPRDHRPPVRSASEGKPGIHAGGLRASAATPEDGRRGSVHGHENETKEGERRPHTAPTHRQKRFMDAISPRARRILAAQTPGTSLHSAFSTYSNEPFPLRVRRSGLRSASAGMENSAHRIAPARTSGSQTDAPFHTSESIDRTTQQCAWAEIPCSHTGSQTLRAGSSTRPHSAAAEMSKKVQTPPRRPATACGTHEPRESSGNAAVAVVVSPPTQARKREHRSDEQSRDLHVQSGPSVTVLWARLCSPSSDLVYKNSVWPEAPTASRPTRRKARPTERSATAPVSAATEAQGGHEREALPKASRAAPAATDAGGVGGGKAQLSGGKTGVSSPLEDLEDSLFASSSQRVNQRRRVFRGYAERSRREKTWDRGSQFYAEGASKHCAVGPRPCNGGKNRGVGEESGGSPSMGHRKPGSGTKNGKHFRDRRGRSRVSPDIHPVDMDWEKVDIARLDNRFKEVEKVLDGKLFAVVTDDENTGNLSECFQEARELVESTSVLLGCPEDELERFRRQIGGDLGIGRYVSTVSRLHLLWTTACGVVEIVRMMQRRTHLIEAFCSEEDKQPREGASACIEEADDTQHELHAPPGLPTASSRDSCVRRYETRLELAEYAIAIAESIKLWLSVVPWRVQVLYGGEPVLSSLRAEEKALPWPPDPEQVDRSVTSDGALMMPEIERMLGQQQQYCSPCDGKEGSCFEVTGSAPDQSESSLRA